MPRLVRWMFYSVVLAFIPLGMSWMFLPPSTSFIQAISHGELAVLAQALAGASIGTLFDRYPSVRAFEILVTLNIGILLTALVLLAGVTGGAARITPNQAASASIWLLLIAITVGAASNMKVT